ncbi:MAG: TonB-dependent receptor [bacterium]|nr:TonB-dependent receptor [bacterium]
MRQLIVLTIWLLLPCIAFSQNQLTGKVMDKSKAPIANAILMVLNSGNTYSTDSLGVYSILLNEALPTKLIVMHEGYKTDTININSFLNLEIELEFIYSFKGARIFGQNQSTSYIGFQTMKTEVITAGELKKAACCDLAGCFETQGSVQPVTTNIITNSKELRILGLSGVYNQVLIDGMPLIQGLTYTYGISSFPGTLVDNIFIAKGTTSVLQGYESMVGQINVISKSPEKGDKLLLNFYANSFGETQYNMNYSLDKRKWSHLISLHMVQPAQKWDRNRDGFLDLPKLNRYMIFDKIKYGSENKKGLSTMIGLRILSEQRVGGQNNYNPKSNLGSNSIYGQKVNYYQSDLYNKTSCRINSINKFTIISSAFIQDQKSWFGTVQYNALQKSLYSNLQYELTWNGSNDFKTGISFRHLYLNETIGFSDTNLKRTYNGKYLKLENIPGLFAENTFKWKGDIITLITGIRADHHNQFGWQLTPRTMLKYDLTSNATLRASAGTGWRTVNLFSENIGLLVSSRNVVFKEVLKPEKSFNWGINFLQKFTKKQLEGYITVDYYQTHFQNQIFPDYDTDSKMAIISNFSGTSISNGFQTDINAKFKKLIEVKVTYNYLDVYRIENNSKFILPFNSKHKILLGISYITKNKKWRVDLNSHWFGKQRLPNTDKNPSEFKQAQTSKNYALFNLQSTKSWKKLELYGGCENIFNFTQTNPIVSWQNPFSPYFDTSFNWGPTRGREFYIGIRYMPFKEK